MMLMVIERYTRRDNRARALCAILLGISFFLAMMPGQSFGQPSAAGSIDTASSTATLRFDSATGPTTKTIVRNSGTPVTFAWKTTSLPSGTTCKILLRPNDSYNAAASPASGGTRTDSNISTWSVGAKTLYLRCSNGTTSPNITLTIAAPAPTATLRFDSATGPTTKAIAQNSGTPVTFAWKTANLPSGNTCKILLRPNDSYNAAAVPVSGGSRTDNNINTWGVGNKVFYLRCSNGTTSPDITLAINSSSYVLSVQKSGTGSGTVTSSPGGINCGSTCSAHFAIGASVTLTATAGGGGSVFVAWTGACSGTASTCTVTMSAAKTVGAVFARLGNEVRAISTGNAHTCAVTHTGAMRCWGYNVNGELGDGTTTNRSAPVAVPGLAGVQAVSAGDHHTCALTYAGAVWCWGRNLSGQLGDGTVTNRLAPVAVSGLASGVRAISAGGAHTCALTTAGAVKCWGDNLQGQLGDGTGAPRLTPVAVSGLASGVQAIGTGYVHTCALTTAGAVKCWGYNGEGELGDGTTTKRLAPVAVSGLASGIQAISARYTHTCALTTAGAVRCWGENSFGGLGDGTRTNRLTPVTVSGLTSGMKAIGAGYQHTCALTTAGTARCWGNNLSGQLGDGTNTDRLTPVAIVGLSSAQAIDGGTQHTCALTTAGAVRCWGLNAYGSLGDGTFTSRLTPVGTSGLDGDNSVQAVSAGAYHACALITSGTVWCWGDNFVGELGDGTHTSSVTPVAVRGLPGEVRAISAGDGFTCAATTTGAVWCWGVNDAGQLGDGTTTNRSTPVAVSGLTSGVQTIGAGFEHACAVTTAGAVWCWGRNTYGQLGDGMPIDRRLTPVAVSNLASGVQAIGTGIYHTCALTSPGAMWCWGRNTSGQLGDGTASNRSTPVAVSGLGSGVQAISAGGIHTCAITGTGAVRCWGSNSSGELGDGTTTNRLTPVAVSGLFSGVRSIGAGIDHTCAVTGDGMVECWGGIVGELEPGSIGLELRTAPVAVPGLASGARTVSAGLHFTCALTTTGVLRCWGINENGQLGDGTHTQWQWPPVSVIGFGNGAQAISTGDAHACALTHTGTVWCWGFNTDGQLGDGTTTARPIPVAVSGLGDDVRAVSARGAHTCALTRAGAVRCWGDNDHGQLGDGTRSPRLTPVAVSGLGSGVQAISAGIQHTCALTNAGAVRCWGDNTAGQLGDGTITDRVTPVTVSGLASGVRAISAGAFHTCALTSAGAVRCWGDNESGVLGDGTVIRRLTPVAVSGLSSGVLAISAGEVHTCAVTTAGAARCWGWNAYGQLGDGTHTDRLTPVAVSGLASGVQAINAALEQTCAVARAGAVRCWGGNDYGQLGDGTATDRPTPVTVSGLDSGGQAVSGGVAFTCALAIDGTARCWGSNANGQLGNGTTTSGLTPVKVVGL